MRYQKWKVTHACSWLRVLTSIWQDHHSFKWGFHLKTSNYFVETHTAAGREKKKSPLRRKESNVESTSGFLTDYKLFIDQTLRERFDQEESFGPASSSVINETSQTQKLERSHVLFVQNYFHCKHTDMNSDWIRLWYWRQLGSVDLVLMKKSLTFHFHHHDHHHTFTVTISFVSTMSVSSLIDRFLYFLFFGLVLSLLICSSAENSSKKAKD